MVMEFWDLGRVGLGSGGFWSAEGFPQTWKAQAKLLLIYLKDIRSPSRSDFFVTRP